MPLYHFNIAGQGSNRDTEGTELAGPVEARRQAVIFAGDYLSDNPDVVWNGREFQVEVTNAEGQTLFIVVVMAIDAVKGEDATR